MSINSREEETNMNDQQIRYEVNHDESMQQAHNLGRLDQQVTFNKMVFMEGIQKVISTPIGEELIRTLLGETIGYDEVDCMQKHELTDMCETCYEEIAMNCNEFDLTDLIDYEDVSG